MGAGGCDMALSGHAPDKGKRVCHFQIKVTTTMEFVWRETEEAMETGIKQNAEGSRSMVLRAPVSVTRGLMSESRSHREWRLAQLPHLHHGPGLAG